jgi:hypothetical protein
MAPIADRDDSTAPQWGTSSTTKLQNRLLEGLAQAGHQVGTHMHGEERSLQGVADCRGSTERRVDGLANRVEVALQNGDPFAAAGRFGALEVRVAGAAGVGSGCEGRQGLRKRTEN